MCPTPSDEDGAPTFFVEVTFDYRRRQYVCRSEWSDMRPRKIGRPLAVLIPDGRPQEARINSFWESWGLAMTYGVVGGACVAFGAVLIVSAS
jgi:hypothetical protein